MSSAIPVQSSWWSPAPRRIKSVYERRAPQGVEALNAMRCFLHSERESVESREVVKASAVGAVEKLS
jgi:hypothetical protein